MININEYTTLLLPTNQSEFYKNPYILQFKLIIFYKRLKYANQMVSEGKVACPTQITWECDLQTKGVNSINCRQANIMLKLISSDFKNIGVFIRYAISFQQATKFKLQQNRNGLTTNDPNKIKKPN